MGSLLRNHRSGASGKIAMGLALPMIILWITLAGNSADVLMKPKPNIAADPRFQGKIPLAVPTNGHVNQKNAPPALAGSCGQKEAWFTQEKPSPSDFQSMFFRFLTLCTRSERKEISDDYYDKHYEEIATTLKNLLPQVKEDANEIIFSQMSGSTSELLASKLRDATELGLIDYATVRLIFTTFTDVEEVERVTEMYQAWFDEDLGEVLSRKTRKDADLRRIMSTQLQGRRPVDLDVDDEVRGVDVDQIWDEVANNGLKAEDSDTHSILLSMNYHDLRDVLALYKKTHGDTLKSALKRTFSPDAAQAYIDAIAFAEDKDAWFALKLRSALSTNPIDISTVIFIASWRADIDLCSIKDAYKRLYKISLHDDIKNVVKKDVPRELLLKIIGE